MELFADGVVESGFIEDIGMTYGNVIPQLVDGFMFCVVLFYVMTV